VAARDRYYEVYNRPHVASWSDIKERDADRSAFTQSGISRTRRRPSTEFGHAQFYATGFDAITGALRTGFGIGGWAGGLGLKGQVERAGPQGGTYLGVMVGGFPQHDDDDWGPGTPRWQHPAASITTSNGWRPDPGTPATTAHPQSRGRRAAGVADWPDVTLKSLGEGLLSNEDRYPGYRHQPNNKRARNNAHHRPATAAGGAGLIANLRWPFAASANKNEIALVLGSAAGSA